MTAITQESHRALIDAAMAILKWGDTCMDFAKNNPELLAIQVFDFMIQYQPNRTNAMVILQANAKYDAARMRQGERNRLKKARHKYYHSDGYKQEFAEAVAEGLVRPQDQAYLRREATQFQAGKPPEPPEPRAETVCPECKPYAKYPNYPGWLGWNLDGTRERCERCNPEAPQAKEPEPPPLPPMLFQNGDTLPGYEGYHDGLRPEHEDIGITRIPKPGEKLKFGKIVGEGDL